MPKVEAFYTNSREYPPTDRIVYHDNSACANGERIESGHRLKGRGGRLHCEECLRLALEGR